MATSRKSGAKSGKAKKSARKAAATRPARKSAQAKRRPARPAKAKAKSGKLAKESARKATGAAAKRAGKAVPRVIGRPAVKGKGPATKGLSAAAAKKIEAAARRAEAAQRVRPLGVLPPESRARSTGRAVVPPRPVVAAKSPKAIRPALTSTGAQKVTDKELKDFEQRLLSERQRIMKEMGHLESTVLKVNPRDSAGDLSGYSFHMADAGTDAMEREKAFLFASTEGRLLLEIDDALRRLYRGEYGMCESCGKPIARARLEAMPNARLCVDCKEKEERARRSGQGQGQSQ
jgi:DnaK suppressor protein